MRCGSRPGLCRHAPPRPPRPCPAPPRRRGKPPAAPPLTTQCRADLDALPAASARLPSTCRPARRTVSRSSSPAMAAGSSASSTWRAHSANGRRGHRRRHAPVLRQPAPRGRTARCPLPDDRRRLRDAQPQGAEADRHERIPRAGAGRLLLGRHRGVRDAGAVATGHVRRRAESRLLRRPGFRRRATLCPGAGLHYTAERAARAGTRARRHPARAVDRAAGTEGSGVRPARRG